MFKELKSGKLLSPVCYRAAVDYLVEVWQPCVTREIRQCPHSTGVDWLLVVGCWRHWTADSPDSWSASPVLPAH